MTTHPFRLGNDVLVYGKPYWHNYHLFSSFLAFGIDQSQPLLEHPSAATSLQLTATISGKADLRSSTAYGLVGQVVSYSGSFSWTWTRAPILKALFGNLGPNEFAMAMGPYNQVVYESPNLAGAYWNGRVSAPLLTYGRVMTYEYDSSSMSDPVMTDIDPNPQTVKISNDTYSLETYQSGTDSHGNPIYSQRLVGPSTSSISQRQIRVAPYFVHSQAGASTDATLFAQWPPATGPCPNLWKAYIVDPDQIGGFLGVDDSAFLGNGINAVADINWADTLPSRTANFNPLPTYGAGGATSVPFVVNMTWSFS